MALDGVVLKLLLVGALCKIPVTIHLLLLPHVQLLAVSLPLNHLHLPPFSFPDLPLTVLSQHWMG